MSPSQDNFEFPSKRPISKMRDLMESGELQDVQILTEQDSVLVDLPVNANPGKLIPKVFRMPAQAMGVGISTIARILRLKVIFRASPDLVEDEVE